MRLQMLKDEYGKNAGVFVPINDWNAIVQKHEDLKELVDAEPRVKKKLSDLAGTLSSETTEDMIKYITESRSEWEDRMKKQF